MYMCRINYHSVRENGYFNSFQRKDTRNKKRERERKREIERKRERER